MDHAELGEMYKRVNFFDFDAKYGRNRKRKLFEHLTWDTVYKNLKGRKTLLCEEE